MFEPKMMPGQEPYTPEELKQLYKLVDQAAQAEELIDLDELEDFGRKTKQ